MNFRFVTLASCNFMRSALAIMCVFSILAAIPANAEVKQVNSAVKIETSMGDIILRLDEKMAPVTVKNFLNYVNSGFYTNTLFHRVIKDFMIQGGGYDAAMNLKNTEVPIKNEANNGLKNDKYTIAMARTSDPHSASSQFFINGKNNAFLNYKGSNAQGWGYAVFGKVIKGQEVVDAISMVKTGPSDVPVTPVMIKSISIVE